MSVVSVSDQDSTVYARVRAAAQWRGVHTVGVRDSLDAIKASDTPR